MFIRISFTPLGLIKLIAWIMWAAAIWQGNIPALLMILAAMFLADLITPKAKLPAK